MADGATGRGIAIDENTVVILNLATDTLEAFEAHGAGQAWVVEACDGVVHVDRRTAG